jgi:hypothetical protein
METGMIVMVMAMLVRGRLAWGVPASVPGVGPAWGSEIKGAGLGYRIFSISATLRYCTNPANLTTFGLGGLLCHHHWPQLSTSKQGVGQ